MSLNQLHRKQVITLYCLLFYVLMVAKWWSGLFLYQLQPVVYATRFDVVAWLLMSTGLHEWLMARPAALVAFDAVFYTMPLLYWLVLQRSNRLAWWVAVVMLLVNWVYVQCYTLYPANSIESFTAWLLFPILLLVRDMRGFYYLLHCLRYFFLFLFASAGVWKIVQLGVFHFNQMSGVLLYQHKEFLASSPNYWLSDVFYWLINRPNTSYVLYLAATLLELAFAVGFFTRRFDKWLLAGFALFLVLDLFVMRIYYWELAPFALTLLYSGYRLPFRDKFTV